MFRASHGRRSQGRTTKEVTSTFEEEDAYAASEELSWPSDGNWIPFDDEGANSVSFDSSAAAWSPPRQVHPAA